MSKIRLRKTCNDVVEVEPKILRETKTTRLIFKSQIINNARDKQDCIKGWFIFQKKGRNDEWEDIKDIQFNKLKNGEGAIWRLKSNEVSELFKFLTKLYNIYSKHGIPKEDSMELPNFDFKIEDFIKYLDFFLEKREVIEHHLNRISEKDIEKLSDFEALIGLINLKKILNIWKEKGEKEKKEEYWQKLFEDYPIIISQLFPYPVVLFKGKAFVGGKTIDNKGGNIADFIFRNNLTENILIIEIKTPNTPLLGKEYRKDNVYSISHEMSGAINQVLNYKDSLLKDYSSLSRSNKSFKSFNPNCLIIAGNYNIEIKGNDTKEKSFELFRSVLHGVDIITFDELFDKLKILVDLLEKGVS